MARRQILCESDDLVNLKHVYDGERRHERYRPYRDSFVEIGTGIIWPSTSLEACQHRGVQIQILPGGNRFRFLSKT